MAADLVLGDEASVLRVTVRDSETNEPMPLDGRTVTLRYKLNGGTLITKTMTLLNQTSNKGQSEYKFLAADLPAAGVLEYEVRLDDGTSNQLTSVAVQQLTVRAPLS